MDISFLAQMNLPPEIGSLIGGSTTACVVWTLAKVHGLAERLNRIEDSLKQLREACPRIEGKDCTP